MDEMILRKSDSKEVEREVRLAFLDYSDQAALAQSPLAYSSLVGDCLLAGDEKYPSARGIALRTTLDWALEKVLAQGTHEAQESHELLVKRYLKGMSNKEYADLKMLTDPGAQKRRESAIKRVVKVLRHEIESQAEGTVRKQLMIRQRVASCEPDEQLLLRFLAIFRGQVRLSMAHQVAEIPFDLPLAPLYMVNLLVSVDPASMIGVHPEIRPYLLTLFNADEHLQWHTAAGALYQARGEVIEAVYHLQQAEQAEQAAQLLIAHQDQIGDGLPIAPLQERLTAFRRPTLSVDRWAQLKILAGRAAEVSQELAVAQSAYEKALAAEDDAIKAEAYYWLARLYEQRDMEAAFIHYQTCQTLFSGVQRQKGLQLLADAYIRSAWLYIEKTANFNRAKANLRQVEPILELCEGKKGHRLRSDYHSTWGTFYARQPECDPAPQQQHYWRAWQYARQGEDVEQVINSAYNLGSMYFLQAQYEEAQRYWQESLQKALEADNQRMVALSKKGIGSCYVSGWQDYQKAVSYYTEAYHYFDETNNDYWKIFVCYDLAEAYAELSHAREAKTYFDEAIQMAQLLKNSRWLTQLEQLAKTYPELLDDLRDRQRQAIGYMRQKGQITNREYCELTGIKKRMATSDLKALLKKGICEKVGKGRSTRYQLVA